ncbi:MAG: PEP-CTERM sorting domain-containing protein [Lacipirellulaceae bacterium]
MSTFVTKSVTSIAIVAALASPTFAQHSDVLVRVGGGQTLVGGAIDLESEEGGPFFNLEARVFEGVFVNPAMPTPPFGFDFERDEPGFYNDPTVTVGDNLPANTGLTLREDAFVLASGVDTTFFWSGAGEVDFQPLSRAQPGVDLTFAPASPDPFASTDTTGFVDDHPLFGLTGGAADGVYLSRVRLTASGFGESEPFYFVWLASSVLTSDLDAEELEGLLEEFENGGPAPVFGGVDFSFYEEAVEFAAAIPEPSSIVIAALGLIGFACRSRV